MSLLQKTLKAKMGWGSSSSGRATACQVQDPEFKTSVQPKNEKCLFQSVNN
jgi:hypothetical protein